MSMCSPTTFLNLVKIFYITFFNTDATLYAALCYVFARQLHKTYLCTFPTGRQHAHVTDNFPELNTDILGEKKKIYNLKANHSCYAFSIIRSTIYAV